MTSTRPYLIRAIYEWAVENGFTPYLLAEASREGVEVPSDRVQDDRIVLNIAPRAVANLELGNDLISFSARFAGIEHHILLPVNAVLAVYARENGIGIVLPENDEQSDAEVGEARATADAVRKTPQLKIVK